MENQQLPMKLGDLQKAKLFDIPQDEIKQLVKQSLLKCLVYAGISPANYPDNEIEFPVITDFVINNFKSLTPDEMVKAVELNVSGKLPNVTGKRSDVNAVGVTPKVETFGRLTTVYLSDVFNNYLEYKRKNYKPEPLPSLAPANSRTRNIAAVKQIFERHKQNKPVYGYYSYYGTLTGHMGNNIPLEGFKLAAEKMQQDGNGLTEPERKKAEARANGNEDAFKSIKTGLNFFDPKKRTVEEIQKELAVKSFFNQLIKEGKEL